MKTIKKHLLIISIAIAMAPTRGYGMMAAWAQKAQACALQAKEVASLASTKLAKFYKAESVRTAAIRSAMALSCLADGACSGSDATILALATASTLTALTYDATSEQRCGWLPKQFNLLADGIATIASYDASVLSITGSPLEAAIRSVIGGLSVTATALAYLPISQAELAEYLKIVRAYLQK